MFRQFFAYVAHGLLMAFVSTFFPSLLFVLFLYLHFPLLSFFFLFPVTRQKPPTKKVQNKEKIGARWVLVMVAWQAWALWMGLEVFGVQRWLMYAGPAPGFGLPKPVTISVAHLLLNIKKYVPKFFLCKINVILRF